MLRGSFDEVMETQLDAVGPSSDGIDPKAQRKKTEAWSGGEATPVKSKPSSAVKEICADTPTSTMSKSLHKLALGLVLLQVIWALIIPAKNIAVVIYPTTRADSENFTVLKYVLNNTNPLVFPGRELVPLLKEVLKISIESESTRQELEASGSFDLDRIYKLLTLEEFAVISKYYSLVLQSSEFPGGTFTPRSFISGSQDKMLSILLRDTSQTSEIRDIEIALACSTENSFLQASKCTTDDGYPCPADFVHENETRHYEDVDLKSLAGNSSGLENNIGLLYVVDFFHQAMSVVFATRDWNTTLEDLNFDQLALSTGTTSVFKNNTPYLFDSDVYLVGVQVADVESLRLDSCVSSELVVAQFYTRAFVLKLIQEALIKYKQYRADTLLINVPDTTEVILHPIFHFNLSITSGATYSSIRHKETNFLRHFPVALLTRVHGQLKLDHHFNSATQVAGSSMRMIQYMSFFSELVSVYETESKVNDDGVDYEYQNFKLIGASGSGINTFKDSSTAANSWMVYPLTELSESFNDTWWDDELEYAAWFRHLEADASTAPFRIFDDALTISSVAPVTPVDDNVETRCKRALFKVVGKIAYLALLELSKPTSYLMFMADVAVGQRNWLLNQIYKEELIGESFFGERIAFSYRNGVNTRKDDGSAWVVIPLLNAMIEYYGQDDTLAYLLQELDSSLQSFVKSSRGNLHFPDTAYCRVSGMGEYVVTDSDTLEEIYTKIYPGLNASFTSLLDLVPDLSSRMNAAMVAKNITPIVFQKEQILGNPVITTSEEGMGAPVDWQPSAFMAGMRKFWPPKTPLQTTVDAFRTATRCYHMLELRYLNMTMRCVVEPGNVRVELSRYQSEALRKFLLSNWSMAIMLNTIAGGIVFKYLRKIIKAWEATKFACLDVQVALQLNFQGMGVLNISQSLLLLVATLPTLIGFHVPEDHVFMPFYRPHQEKLPKIIIDFLVTLSMSWFMKVGFEVCNEWITPKKPADWYDVFRFRWVMLIMIFGLRMITPDGGENGTYQMWKLVVTCIVSLALGACCTVVVFLPNRRGKVVDGSRKEGHDAVIAALVKQNLPLNRYGVLGRSSNGWSKTGLIVEGWKLVQTDNRGNQVLRKGAGEILLPPRTNVHLDGEVHEATTPTTI